MIAFGCSVLLQIGLVSPERIHIRGIYTDRLTYISGNGYIEGKELDNFLREFISSVNVLDTGPEVSSFAKISLVNCTITSKRKALYPITLSPYNYLLIV